MGKEIGELRTTTHVADVVHHGEKLIVPEGMGLDSAIDLLKRRKDYMNQKVNLSETFDVFPWDGAYALSQVLVKKFGWAEGVAKPGLFGETKPHIIRVAVSHDAKADVPWGAFSLPNVAGLIHTGIDRIDGRIVFDLNAEVLRRDEHIVKEIFADVGEYLRHNSLYRGKAIRIRFRDDDGDIIQLPHPEFIDTSKALPGKLIFSKHIEEMIESNLFIPITRVDDCIANSIKVKRGILLGGKYGTGKTLAASVAAHLAEKHGITYVYTPRANELSDAIAFAKQYQSPACVVFCEDIDRAVFGDRSVKMDDILNILDGIDTKSHRIITVLTTNHLENINQAMLRPGRLDAIINVEAPDAEAAQRLVRMYGGGAIPLTEDLTAVGVILNGQIPAVIEETVKRAKLYQLGKTPRGGAVTGLTADAILTAAKTMATQIDLLREKKEDKKITMDGVLKGLVNEALGEYYD